LGGPGCVASSRRCLRRVDRGFTNVDLGTVGGHRIVVLPQNWTVKTQSAKAGTQMAANAKVVLGCARIGGNRWPWSRALEASTPLAADSADHTTPAQANSGLSKSGGGLE
jgi:hypothetical protein